jgi:hypothetical protein
MDNHDDFIQKITTGLPFCMNFTWNGETLEAGGHPDDPSYQVIVPVETFAIWYQGTLTEEYAFELIRQNVKITIETNPRPGAPVYTEERPGPIDRYYPPDANPRPFGNLLSREELDKLSDRQQDDADKPSDG